MTGIISDSQSQPSREVDVIDPSDKSPAVTQAPLTDGGTSRCHEAESLVFVDKSSDASTVNINSHGCMCGSVCAGCERCGADQECGSSDCTVIECTGDNQDLEFYSLEPHSSNVECKFNLG
jgi:hypothetical protein